MSYRFCHVSVWFAFSVAVEVVVELELESELESSAHVCLVEVVSVVPGASLLRRPSVVVVVVVVDSALETPVELEDLVVGAKKRPS